MKRPSKLLTAFIVLFAIIVVLVGVQAAILFEQTYQGNDFVPSQPATITGAVQYSLDNSTYSGTLTAFILGNPLFTRFYISTQTGLTGQPGFVDFQIYESNTLKYTITTANFTYSGAGQIVYCPQQLTSYVTTTNVHRVDARVIA